jgi:hypothetical protein
MNQSVITDAMPVTQASQRAAKRVREDADRVDQAKNIAMSECIGGAIAAARRQPAPAMPGRPVRMEAGPVPEEEQDAGDRGDEEIGDRHGARVEERVEIVREHAPQDPVEVEEAALEEAEDPCPVHA